MTRPSPTAGGAPQHRGGRVLVITGFAVITSAVVGAGLVAAIVGLHTGSEDGSRTEAGLAAVPAVPAMPAAPGESAGLGGSGGPGGSAAPSGPAATSAARGPVGQGAASLPSAPTADGLTPVRVLRPEECFDLPGENLAAGSALERVPVRPCAQEHDAEIFAAYPLAEGDWPGQPNVEKAAAAGCQERFGAFVGVDYADSTLEYGVYPPARASWRAGDRRVWCYVGRPEQPVKGTLRGSRR